jgi:glycine cleavage system transcriptional repressor
MKKYGILSATGADRPGIVHDVSQFMFEHGCNLEDSRMSVLGGQFALIALFSGEEHELDSLTRSLQTFEHKTALRAMVTEAEGPHTVKRAPALPVRLEVVAMDAPGILAQISDVLEKHRVNVDSLDAHLAPAPTSGTTVSSIKMKISVPQDVPLKTVKDALTDLADHINLDLLFQPVQE